MKILKMLQNYCRNIFVLLFSTVIGFSLPNPYNLPMGVTDIVGVTVTTLEPGYTLMALPYKNEPSYSGSIEEINGNILTLHTNEYDDVWPINKYVDTRHYVFVHDSFDGNKGRFYDIIASDATTVTIDDNYGIPNIHDGIHIIPYVTLNQLFGPYEEFIDKDYIIRWASYGWTSFTYRNNQWYKPGTRATQGESILRPDEGIVYHRTQTEPLEFITDGTAYEFAQIPVPLNGLKQFVANPYPTTIEVNTLLSDAYGAFGSNDLLYIWMGSSWDILQYTPSISGFVDITTNEVNRNLQSHQPFFIIKENPSAIFFIESKF